MVVRLGDMHRRFGRLGPSLALLAAIGCDPAADPSSESAIRTLDSGDLAQSLDAGTVVLDVRDRADFDAGHIAGATWLDPSSLRATVDEIEGQVVPRSEAEAVFGAAGLSPDEPIVIAGADNGTGPARVAWTLRYYGHTGPVSLLDGGMQAWLDQDGSVTTDAPARGATGYVGEATREPLRVDQAWVLEHLDDEDVAIFDVRTTEEYDAGHIPDAVHVDWTTNVGADGLFVDAEQVRTLHGEPDAATLVVYCRTGSRASVSWALLRAAGYDDVRLYDGSWTEWGSDPDTPKDTAPSRP